MTELRMRDLCAASGLQRQAIHFYIQQGLLPPGRKQGRNQAVYGAEHLERLRTIRRLQHERFLPLSAIRAVLTQDDEGLSAAQREFLRELREELPQPQDLVEPRPLVEEGAVSAEDLERVVALGFVAGERGKDGVLRVPAQQLPLLRTLGELRAVGLSPALGFEVDDLAPIFEGVRRLVAQEAALVARRLAGQSRSEVGPLIRETLPIIQRLLAQLHEISVHDQLSAF